MSPINWNLPRRKRSIGKNSRNNKLYRKDINYICLLFNNNKVLSDTQKEIIGMYFS